jgi:2-oxoglutarate dehydrogenase E2 component (dihydrolipoamide succinyltransferase)
MAKFELKLPKMGESVAEATITNWLKKVGDKIEIDEAVLEIATDKVDSEIPSEISGVLSEILFNVDDIVKVGQTIAIIETEGQNASPVIAASEVAPASVVAVEEIIEKAVAVVSESVNFSSSISVLALSL